MNNSFKDLEESPLKKGDLARFRKLKYFKYDEKYVVTATITLTPDAEPFKMATSTARKPVYVKYGIARFMIDQQPFELSIYRNEENHYLEGYEDYLFLPFKDQTNGTSSYGGGRYIDLRIEEGATIEIDFNKAYNPYCAYNDRYSCPIPPRENYLAVEIKAGVKAYKKH